MAGVADAKASLSDARAALAVSHAAVSGKAQAQVMINQAQGILDAVLADGSSGVHAPNCTRQKAGEAKLLAVGAKEMAAGVAGGDGGGTK
jgi:mannose/cellobiose epimerase-like protein (N-acyl-D-glucosamine 2-epimerase family)